MLYMSIDTGWNQGRHSLAGSQSQIKLNLIMYLYFTFARELNIDMTYYKICFFTPCRNTDHHSLPSPVRYIFGRSDGYQYKR